MEPCDDKYICKELFNKFKLRYETQGCVYNYVDELPNINTIYLNGNDLIIQIGPTILELVGYTSCVYSKSIFTTSYGLMKNMKDKTLFQIAAAIMEPFADVTHGIIIEDDRVYTWSDIFDNIDKSKFIKGIVEPFTTTDKFYLVPQRYYTQKNAYKN